MPRSMQNLSRGSRMFEEWPIVVLQSSCTITIIITCDHRSTANYGGLQMVREAQQNVLQPSQFTLWMLHGACNNFFICRIMANVLHISKQSAHSKVHAEPCRKMQNASTALADYHILPHRFSRHIFPQTIETINRHSVTGSLKDNLSFSSLS